MGDRLISHPAAGLTLIELMIVVTMLATLSVGAVLALRPTATDHDRDVLSALWDRQRSLAITGQDRRGLDMTPRGVQVVHWRAGTWQAVGEMRPWQARAALVGPPPAPDQPSVVFLPDGRSSPFEIRWANGSGTCRSTEEAELSCAE